MDDIIIAGYGKTEKLAAQIEMKHLENSNFLGIEAACWKKEKKISIPKGKYVLEISIGNLTLTRDKVNLHYINEYKPHPTSLCTF